MVNYKYKTAQSSTRKRKGLRHSGNAHLDFALFGMCLNVKNLLTQGFSLNVNELTKIGKKLNYLVFLAALYLVRK